MRPGALRTVRTGDAHPPPACSAYRAHRVPPTPRVLGARTSLGRTYRTCRAPWHPRRRRASRSLVISPSSLVITPGGDARGGPRVGALVSDAAAGAGVAARQLALPLTLTLTLTLTLALTLGRCRRGAVNRPSRPTSTPSRRSRTACHPNPNPNPTPNPTPSSNTTPNPTPSSNTTPSPTPPSPNPSPSPSPGPGQA